MDTTKTLKETNKIHTNMVKMGRVVPETSLRADRHADGQTFSSQYSPTEGKVTS